MNKIEEELRDLCSRNGTLCSACGFRKDCLAIKSMRFIYQAIVKELPGKKELKLASKKQSKNLSIL